MKGKYHEYTYLYNVISEYNDNNLKQGELQELYCIKSKNIFR